MEVPNKLAKLSFHHTLELSFKRYGPTHENVFSSTNQSFRNSIFIYLFNNVKTVSEFVLGIEDIFFTHENGKLCRNS